MFSPESPPSIPREPPPDLHPIIQTPRLLLRSPLPEDIEPIHYIRTHPRVAEWHNPSKTTDPVSDTEGWLARITVPQKTFSFVIQLLSPIASENNAGSPDPIIGVISMTINPKTSLPTIGYFISPEYWNQGYVPEAMSASLAKYWEVYPDGLPGSKGEGKGRAHVDATAVAQNVASVRVLEKCGFELVAHDEVVDNWHGGPKIQLVRYRFWRPDR